MRKVHGVIALQELQTIANLWLFAQRTITV
jgi:hypothetical protein